MYTKPTTQQLSALVKVSRSTEGLVMLDLLEKELAELTRRLVESDGVATPRLQGAALAYKRLIEALRESPRFLEQAQRAQDR